MPRHLTYSKQTSGNNSYKPFYSPLDRKDLAQKSYEHFKKTGRATLMPPDYKPPARNFSTTKPTSAHQSFRQSVSSNTAAIPAAMAKTMGKKYLMTKINEAVVGLGSYLGKKITFTDASISFETARRQSLIDSNSPSAAFVCSVLNVSTKLATKTIGYSALTTAASSLTTTTGPVGVATSIAFWGTGTALVESSSATAGDLTQKACHAAFKWGEQSNSSSSSSIPQYKHY